jgi:GNAT superfamily N-acetyltransferase
VDVRDARLDERAALEALQRRSSDVWQEYREQLAAHPDAIEVSTQAIRQGRTRVARDRDGALVGFSVVEPVRDGAVELDGLFVEPGRMHRGVGRLLVEDVIVSARRRGATRIDVTAGPAAAFYEKLGFERGEAVATRFGQAIRMSLALGAACNVLPGARD